MKLRTQVALTSCATVILSGALGLYLIKGRAEQLGDDLLDRELRVGRSAFERQWRLRYAERRAVYQGLVAQPYVRTVVADGERGELARLVTTLLKSGADAAAVLDRNGRALAAEGAGGTELALLGPTLAAEPARLRVINGKPALVVTLPVGDVGLVLAANRVDATTLLADVTPFGVEVGILVQQTFVTTLPDALASPAVLWLGAARAGPMESIRELGPARDRLRAEAFTLDGAKTMVAIHKKRIEALTVDSVRLAGVLMALIAFAVVIAALVIIRRITDPIVTLQKAAVLLGQGRLAQAAHDMAPLAERRDEIGELASEYAGASRRLYEIVESARQLSLRLDSEMVGIERVAESVAHGATQLADFVGPVAEAFRAARSSADEARTTTRHLIHTLERDHDRVLALEEALARVRDEGNEAQGKLARGEGDARAAQRVLKRQVHEHEGMAHLMAQLRGGLKDVTERLQRLAEEQAEREANETRAGMSQRLQVKRALLEVGRVTREHVSEAASLRHSAQSVRDGSRRLREELSTLVRSSS